MGTVTGGHRGAEELDKTALKEHNDGTRMMYHQRGETVSLEMSLPYKCASKRKL